MKPFEILLLGPPEVHWQNKIYPIQRKTPRLLLFYLASRGSWVGRNELIRLFWGDESDEVARLRLRENLNKLKSSLPENDLILSDKELVGLDFDRVAVDLLEFRKLALAAVAMARKSSPIQHLTLTVHENLSQAANLWRSPTFMAGIDTLPTPELDNWFMTTGQEAEMLHGRVLECLGEIEENLGNLENALHFTQAALIGNEWEEKLHEQVMHLLIRLGKNQQARDYFKNYQTRLWKELGLKPGPRLTALFRQVQASPTQPLARVEPDWNIQVSLRVGFIGRKKYLEELEASYRQGRLVFVLGEAGIGKTRLISEFATKATPAPLLLLAQCRETESNLPFQPIIDLLRQHVTPEIWKSLNPAWASHLSVLLPELVSYRPALKPPAQTTPELARSQVLEAIRNVFLLLAQSQRLIFVLSNCHWTDEASMATVSYLVSRPPFDRHGLIIVSARSDEFNPYLKRLVESHKPSANIKHILLTQLSLDEIHELSSRALGAIPSPQFVEKLAQETGGNPLFILETLNTILRQEPNPDLENPQSLPISASLVSLIQRRLQNLSEASRETLEYAAIFGDEFDPNLLSEATGRSGEELIGILVEWETRNIIERIPQPNPGLQYRFIHDKIREALLSSMHPVHAQVMHRKAAKILENRLAGTPAEQAAVLAQHYEAANDWLAAFTYWVQAGHHAYMLFARNEAQKSFERAEKLIDHILYQLDENQILELYLEWGRMVFSSGDVLLMSTLAENLQRWGELRQSHLLRGSACMRKADLCRVQNRFEEGLRSTQAAILHFEKTDNTLQLTNARMYQGIFLYTMGRITEAFEPFENALAMVKEATDTESVRLRANLHYELGLTRTLAGWPGKGRSHALESLSEFDSLNNADGKALSYSGLILAEFFLGDYQQALKHSQEGNELCWRAESWRQLGYISNYRAMVDLAMGNLDGLVEYAEQAIQLSQKHGLVETAANAYRLLADGYLWLKEYKLAADYYRRSFETSLETFLSVDALFRYHLSLCFMGQIDENVPILTKLIEQTGLGGLGISKYYSQMALSIACMLGQDWDRSYQVAKELVIESEERKIPIISMTSLHLMGSACLGRGDLGSGLHFLTAASLKAAQVGHAWVELECLAALMKACPEAEITHKVYQPRVASLLELIASRCTKPLFRPYLEGFIKKIEFQPS